jgi:hypothetical protein
MLTDSDEEKEEEKRKEKVDKIAWHFYLLIDACQSGDTVLLDLREWHSVSKSKLVLKMFS